MKESSSVLARTRSGVITRSLRSALKRDWQLYLLLVLPVAFVLIFKYAAYPGLRIAFMNYKPARGYSGSEYVGLEIFQKIFKDADFLRALKNSLAFNFLDLAIGFPVPIILALMLNELRFRRFKRLSQTVLYLPHFLSWVIIASVAYSLFRPSSGLVNIALMKAGLISEGIPFLTEKFHWAVTYLLMAVWQNMGWGTIIFLAAITGINPELYEAATVDGASRMRKIWHVTLPGIRATAVTLLILNLGRIMGSNYERLASFGNVLVKDYQYQLAIYIYEKGLAGGNFSKATAVGLFQSLLGFVLVLAADRFAKSLGENGLI
ncbi:MAG TPA: ABC transporter permease subunit [Candidatus Limiplasma sp.]|nr:ABC transporter permease subunit [Candidatus Limiplasma sp.]HRX08493.1 ABC transporter permease subunit [Candidatus Limiplasma sp.]